MYDCPEFDEIRAGYPWVGSAVLPHHFDSDTFKPLPGVEKDIDILLYGDVSRAYPLRMKLRKLLKTKLKHLNIQYIRRPAYFISPKSKYKNIHQVEKHRRHLNELINRSKMCVATQSRYGYFVCKYLEITAAGSKVVGNLDRIGKLFLSEFCVEVTSDNAVTKILAQVRNWDNHSWFLSRPALSIQNHYGDNLLSIVERFSAHSGVGDTLHIPFTRP
jgi:hypothetical protein